MSLVISMLALSVSLFTLGLNVGLWFTRKKQNKTTITPEDVRKEQAKARKLNQFYSYDGYNDNE